MSFFNRKKKASSESSEKTLPQSDAVSTSDDQSVVASAPTPASAVDSAHMEPLETSSVEPLSSDSLSSESVLAASREMLMDRAYDDWHAELTARIAVADQRQEQRAPGRIDLTQVHPTGAAQFYSYQATRLSSLIREERLLTIAQQQLSRLRDDLDITAQKFGHAPASLAVGRITWTELPVLEKTELPGDSYRHTGELHLSHASASSTTAEQDSQQSAELVEHEKPVRSARVVHETAIFRPVRLFFHSAKDALVQLLPNAEINLALVRALRNHGATAEEIAQLRQLAASSESVDVLMTRLMELGRIYLPGFHYEASTILGSFFHPERTMLADLEAMEPYIRTSNVMAALAGDEQARQLSSTPLPSGNPADRDPDSERGVGDRDVAELDVVEAVAGGHSLVVDCPPGSQRVGTMAAIAADVVASGRSLIIVPSRASSTTDIVNELEKQGLGDLVADFSDVEAIPMRLRTGMRVERPDLPTDEMLEKRTELMRVRSQLETFMKELHTVDPHWQTSVYDLLEKLAAATQGKNAPLTKVRLDGPTLQGITDTGVAEIVELLRTAGEQHAFDPALAHSAWMTTDISDAAMGQQALDAARRLAEVSIPAVMSQSSRAAGETGLNQANTLAQWLEQIKVLDGISESLDIFVPQIFETSAMDMVIATGSRQWREENGHTMRGSERRRFKRQAQDFVRPGAVVSDLHEELVKVQEQREVWSSYTAEGGWPQLPQGLTQIRTTSAELMTDLEFLSEHLADEDFTKLSFEDLRERVAALVADGAHMAMLPERNAVLHELRDYGLGAFLDDMIARDVPAEQVTAEFGLAYASSVFEQLIARSELLAHLGPQDLTELLESFRELDQLHCQWLAGPVKLAVVNNARALMIKRKNDTLKLDSLLARHGTAILRDAIATYQRLVQVSRPIWIVPATIAAEFIPPMPWVDVVLYDTADNATVASSAAALTRGRQMVVMGDVRRAHVVDRENGLLRGLTAVLPVLQLPTHRARIDRLAMEALRAHGYDDVLTPVPAVHASEQPHLIVVDGRGVPSPSADGAIEAPKVEVDAVVEEVLAHAMARPEQSLAVITISPAHAHRVREALRHIGTDSKELEALYEGQQGEPLVITDIYNAGSLRRDHIILSVGYGKTVHGRVLHSFGDLATAAGMTGMIDAIEASRDSLTIISSLAPGDISLDRVSTPGPRLLAQLLSQAGGYHEEKHEVTAGGEVAPLLADLARRIEAAGYRTCAHVGQGYWQIPLIVGHDDIPGTWAVAVTYDDPQYAQQKSLRRRDRYRIDTLAAHGWRVFQTFSTSLFIDPQGQAQQVIDMVNEVRGGSAHADRLAVPAVDGQGEPVSVEPAPEVKNDADSDENKGPVERGPRPAIRPGLQLAGYTDNELEELIAWIASDEVDRSVAQFVEEIRQELDLRRGSQIERVLANVVRRMGVAIDE